MESSRPEPRTSGGVAVSGTKIPTISDFDLIRIIGRGSYGDVWLVRGLTGVYRAVKIVWRDRFSDAEPFEREFEGLKSFTTMSLPESSQLALLHVGRNEADRFFYYVMELADDVETGREVNPERYRPLTLKEVGERRKGLPADECVAIGVELARALAGLHSRALVHRDIKPSNVIMVGGVPKLADIGLVASTADARTYVGTEGYVPPEGHGKPSADVYALGKLLYELVTGLDREDYPRLPPELGKRPDRKALFELDEIILRSCDSDEKRRYPDASAMLADLLVIKQGQSLRLQRVRAKVWRLATVLTLLMTVAGLGYLWRARSISSDASHSSEAGLLVAKAWDQLDKTELDPETLQFADGFCKRASELDPTDANIWAAWSVANTLYVARRFDQSGERREAARADAARALKIAPDSYEARLAQACYLAYLVPGQFGLEARRMLLQLIKERPNEPRALYAYAISSSKGRVQQERQALLRLTQNPQFAARAWLFLARIAENTDDTDGFHEYLDRSIAVEPYGRNLSEKLLWYIDSQGDLDGAESLLATIPANLMQSDDLLGQVFSLYYYERKPDKAVNFLQSIPRDWFYGGDGPGPICWYVAMAQELAGRADIARIEWQRALKMVESKLVEDPSSRKLIVLRSRLLVFLGKYDEAEKSLKLGGQAGAYTDWYGIYLLRTAEGRLDEAWDIFVNHLDGTKCNYAVLKLDPRYDPFRNYPPFKAELAKAAVDPERMPEKVRVSKD